MVDLKCKDSNIRILASRHFIQSTVKRSEGSLTALVPGKHAESVPFIRQQSGKVTRSNEVT